MITHHIRKENIVDGSSESYDVFFTGGNDHGDITMIGHGSIELTSNFFIVTMKHTRDDPADKHFYFPVPVLNKVVKYLDEVPAEEWVFSPQIVTKVPVKTEPAFMMLSEADNEDHPRILR